MAGHRRRDPLYQQAHHIQRGGDRHRGQDHPADGVQYQIQIDTGQAIEPQIKMKKDLFNGEPVAEDTAQPAIRSD